MQHCPALNYIRYPINCMTWCQARCYFQSSDFNHAPDLNTALLRSALIICVQPNVGPSFTHILHRPHMISVHMVIMRCSTFKSSSSTNAKISSAYQPVSNTVA